MIIQKELYHRVQEEKARRGAIYRLTTKKVNAPPVKEKCSSKYVLSDIVVSKVSTAPNMCYPTSWYAQNAVSPTAGSMVEVWYKKSRVAL